MYVFPPSLLPSLPPSHAPSVCFYHCSSSLPPFLPPSLPAGVDLKAEIISAANGGRGGGYSSSSSYPSSSSSSYPSSTGRGSAADFAAQRRKKMKLAKMEDGFQERLAVMRNERGREYRYWREGGREGRKEGGVVCGGRR